MIRTVLGDIEPAQLGACHAHDHVLIGDGVGARQNPNLLIDDVERAVAEVELFAAAGGGALVDAMPLDSGRDPIGLVEVSRRTGVHIVATTGFHTAGYYVRDHWLLTIPMEQLVDLVCAEVTVGLDRYSYSGPVIDRMAARAGLVKAATGADGLDGRARRLLDLAAEVHLRTGAPVLTHTEHGQLALEQLDRLLGRGVPPEAVLISHVDRRHDTGFHAELAQCGAYLVYDGPSRTKYHQPELVIKLIDVTCQAGGAQRILLGLDLALRSYRRSYGGGPGLGYLLESFLPLLVQAGFEARLVDGFVVANPARALSLRLAG
ncbi:MAG: phosphotriesterase family protein [Mycobacteriales bacterium]